MVSAYEVEFVDGDGSTVACITLEAKHVRTIDLGELLHTRRHGGWYEQFEWTKVLNSVDS